MRRNLQSEFRRHLDLGESLLWTGKPKTGIKFRKSDIFLIPFSLLWGGFAIFWELTVLLTDTPFFFALFGIPFVIIGLYLIFGRFIFDALKRKNTIYGITENRIIIKSGIFKPTLKSINIKSISNITLEEKNDKSGTIILGTNNKLDGMFRGSEYLNRNENRTPVLEMIENARSAYRKITELQ